MSFAKDEWATLGEVVAARLHSYSEQHPEAVFERAIDNATDILSLWAGYDQASRRTWLIDLLQKQPGFAIKVLRRAIGDSAVTIPYFYDQIKHYVSPDALKAAISIQYGEALTGRVQADADGLEWARHFLIEFERRA